MSETGFNSKALSGVRNPESRDVRDPLLRNALVRLVPIKPGIESIIEIVRLTDIDD